MVDEEFEGYEKGNMDVGRFEGKIEQLDATNRMKRPKQKNSRFVN